MATPRDFCVLARGQVIFRRSPRGGSSCETQSVHVVGDSHFMTATSSRTGVGLRVVWFASVAWDSVRGTDQQLVAALADQATIVYVDPPRSVVRARRKYPADAGAGLGPVRRLTPLAPPLPYRRGMARITERLHAMQASRILAQVRPDVAVCTCLDPVLGLVPYILSVLVGTDDYVAGAELMHQRVDFVRRAEARQLIDADVVTAVSPELRQRWRNLSGKPVELLPNGCDVAHFAQAVPPIDVGLRPPIAVVMGNLSQRIDLSLLESVASDDMSLVLVGPHDPTWEPERFKALVSRSNVRWLGRRPFEQLPGILATADVGLTPYADDPFNRASNPLKTWEYLAAGLPVVTTPLPSSTRLGKGMVSVASGPNAFRLAVRRAVNEDSPDARVRRLAFARQQSWDARADKLLRLVNRALAEKRAGFTSS